MITTDGAHWPAVLTPADVIASACHFDKRPDPERLHLLPEKLQSAVPKRQAEFLAGRACAAQALVQFGRTDTAVPVGPDRAPVWPGGVVGSITHSAGFAAAMVAPDAACRGIGIDVERLLTEAEARPLMRQIGTEDEWVLLTDDLAPAPAFAVLFSAKEALYKAIYPSVRRFVGFTEVSSVAFGSDTIRFTLPSDICEGLDGMDTVDVSYLIGDGLVYTMCHLARGGAIA